MLYPYVNHDHGDPHDHDHHGHGEHHEHDGHGHGHDGHDGHGHDGHDGHDHAHGVVREVAGGWAFAAGLGLNLAFTAIEVVYGLLARSMALVADAAHNASDVLGLGLAWGAVWLARRAPTKKHTYGLRRSTILAALANGVLLLVVVGGIVWEAIGRLRTPPPVEGTTMIVVAAIGVLVNGVSAAFFARSRKHDVNMRGAFLHLAADAAVSLGVVVSGLVLLKTGWTWIDPAASLLVSMVVLAGTWSLLQEATSLALDAVPDAIDPDAVRGYLASLPGVVEVHDLHIWAMSTTENALTAHLVMPWPSSTPAFLDDVAHELERRHRIHHVTIQIEACEQAPRCKQAPDEAL